MFGRKTKAALQDELERANATIARQGALINTLERRLKMLAVESNFWKSQTVDYGNQIEFWQRKNRELLDEMFKESTNFELRAYADSIKQAILDARPEPSTIAAIIATADKDVQGVFTPPPPRSDTARLVRAEDGGQYARLDWQG